MDPMPVLTFPMSQAGAPIRWSEVIIACDNGMMQPVVHEAVQSVKTGTCRARWWWPAGGTTTMW
jgi:hypothetical protein